ncbi:MAG: hypothetical protein ACXU9S_15265 [Gemmatimonadaceae bacterium]
MRWNLRAAVVSWLLWGFALNLGAAHAQVAPVPDAQVPQRRELLRTDRFTVYLLDLAPGQATPMHRHDLDIASVFPTNARTVSTFWKEPARPDRPAVGAVRFRAAGFTHATANTDTSHFLSVIVAFARSQGRPDSTATGRRSDCSELGASTCTEVTTLFCLKDVCVLDVTVTPGGVWRATDPVLMVPVTSTVWSTPGSNVASPARILAIGTALYEPISGMQWRNEGAIAARLIAFQVRPNVRPNER